jgi:uncharacterized protein YciI
VPQEQIGRLRDVDEGVLVPGPCATVARVSAVAGYYLVRRTKGPKWDHARGRREQDRWDEHAAFMDGLVDEGVIVLGGPVGGPEGDDTMAVMEAETEEAIRARLAQDPWGEEMLVTRSIEPWTVWLRK